MSGFVTVILIFLAVVGVGLVGGTIWGVSRSAGWIGNSNKKALKEAQKKQKTYGYLDASGNISPAEVKKAVSPFVGDSVLGPYAEKVLETFSREESRKSQIMQIVNAEFEPHSMTWDKYTTPLDTAETAITSNAAQIANHLQAFNSKEYEHLGRMDRAGALQDKEAERKQLWTLQKQLVEMDELQESNERIMAELERLQLELNQMSGHGLTQGTDSAIEEIARLADEAKYYA